MLSGLNVDVEYEGTIYHVQTETGSKSKPSLVTIVFKGGAILASHKSSFAHLLESPNLIRELRELMSKQHKETIKEVESGQFLKGQQPSKPQPPQASTAPPSPIPDPAQKKSKPKSLDDLILDYLSTKKEGEE